MALITTHFYSQVLGLTCTMEVILPEPDQGIGVGASVWDGKSDLPVLYLLHGMSDDHTIWLRRTSLDRYVAGRRLAVVMPAVHRSCYSDQALGYDYLTFLAQEVPEVASRFFRISRRREDTFAAGLSMGGYGAMKLGLTYPERYAAVASMSGVLDMWEHSKGRPYLQLIGDQAAEEKLRLENPEAYRNLVDFKLNFGSLDRFRGSDNDLLSLLERRVKSGCELPKLDISIGIQDYLYPTNVTFRHKLDELHVPYRYHEEPGVHEWAVWDRAVTRVLDWLPVEREIPTGNGGDREARRQREEEK